DRRVQEHDRRSPAREGAGRGSNRRHHAQEAATPGSLGADAAGGSMMLAIVAGVVALVATAWIAARAARAEALRASRRAVDQAKLEAARLVKAATLEANAERTRVETA